MIIDDILITAFEQDYFDAAMEIYLQGIQSGHATFRTDIPKWEEWDKGHLACCRIIAFKDKTLVGWAALSPVSTRKVYSGVTEISIYVSTQARQQGIGNLLMKELISQSEKNDIWTLQSSIFPENKASLVLHLTNGFIEVGKRSMIGKMNGVWRDTILLERRSENVGW